LIWYQAGASEATGTTEFVHPFGPLGIQSAIRFLIFGLKHSQTTLLLMIQFISICNNIFLKIISILESMK